MNLSQIAMMGKKYNLKLKKSKTLADRLGFFKENKENIGIS